MSKPQNEKTWLQDWQDSFPFLTGDRAAPFLTMLAHATSRRELREMCRRWLPPHWWLTPQEYLELVKFWGRWYETESRKTQVSDQIIRDHINMVCDDQGLRPHYLGRIATKLSNAKVSMSVQARALDMHMVLHGRSNKVKIQVAGQTIPVVCYRTVGDDAAPEWYLAFLLDQTPLSEPVIRYFEQIEAKLLHYCSEGCYDEVVLTFYSPNLDKLVIPAKGADFGWGPAGDVLLTEMDFYPTLFRELMDQGLSNFVVEPPDRLSE